MNYYSARAHILECIIECIFLFGAKGTLINSIEKQASDMKHFVP